MRNIKPVALLTHLAVFLNQLRTILTSFWSGMILGIVLGFFLACLWVGCIILCGA